MIKLEIKMGLWLKYFINSDKVEMIKQTKGNKEQEKKMGSGVSTFYNWKPNLFTADKWSNRNINIFKISKISTKKNLIMHEN